MQKLAIDKKRLLLAAVISTALAVLSLVGIWLSALNLKYALLVICIVVAIHAIYGAPVYFIAYSDTRICRRIIEAVEGGALEFEKIGELAAVKPALLKKMIKRSLACGYLEGYRAESSALIKTI
jgi:hypothetical protein